MKKLFYTIFLLAIVVLSQAQPIDSLKKANDFYAENKIQEAINSYENIINLGYESATLYFNLGNAYFKNNEPINALVNFERAKLLNPNDEDIQFNLDLVNQFVIDKIEPLPQPFFINWMIAFTNIFDSNTWAMLSVISFIVCLLFALGFVFLRAVNLKKISFSLGIIMLLFSISSFVFASNQKEKMTNHNHAIVFSPSVTVKAEPNKSSVDLFVIHEGLKVEILKVVNSWMEIKLEDGNRGWIHSDVLKII